MKESEALYELVHALTKNEKRYFKMYCSGLSGRGKSNYLALFGALEKQKAYDGIALKRTLKNPALVKNLSAEKNYLFHLILDSLLAYHREEPGHKIRMMISKAQLLFDKGLIKSSSRLLVSAKKLARQYHDKGMLLDILALQSKHIVHLRDVTQMKEYADEKRRLGEEILNENKYTELLSILVAHSLDTTYMRDPEQRSKLDRLMEDELMQEENRAISLQAKLLFYNIRSFYEYLVKSKAHSPENNRRMLRLFEENPGYTSINLNDYLSTLANFISDAMVNKKKEDVMSAIEKLELFPKTYKEHISPVVYTNYRHMYLETVAKVYAWLGEFEKVIALLPEMKTLVSNKRVLKPHRRQSVSFATALALFAHQRYKEALKMLHAVDDIHEAGAGSYVYFIQMMFMRFMTHYEMKNTDVMEEQSAWLRQFLVKQNKLHRTEDQLLAFFTALPQLTSPKAARELFVSTYAGLQDLLKDEYEYPFLMTLMFVYDWIRSKVDHVDFMIVTRERITSLLNAQRSI